MSSFNGDTYTDRQAFEAHARALRQAEFDRVAGIARAGIALTLHRLRAIAVRGARSVADASLAVSPRRGAH